MEIIIENEVCKSVISDEEIVELEPNGDVSPYAKFFNSSCTGWEKDPEYNMLFLRMCQQRANDMLRARGYIFLNEVYDMLGIPRTKAGQCVGWIYNPKNPVGDNYVDFGIYVEQNQEFVNGYKNAILLDFNVDGNIMDVLND